MTIAVVCAMPMEAKAVRRILPAGADAVTIVTGMGTVLAADAVERLLDGHDPELVAVVGIAGAIDSDTPIGSLVWPEAVVHAATGVHYKPAPIGDATPAGLMWTSDALITDPSRLDELRAQGVVALDMETAAVAEVCERRGVRWTVVRAISDRAGDGVDTEVFELAKKSAAAVSAWLATHPGRLPSLMRLNKDSKLAAQAAADAASALLFSR